MLSREHHRLRLFGTLGAIVAHTYLAAIGTVSLLNYTVPSRYSILAEVASDDLWTWLHAICAVVLLVGLHNPTRRIPYFGNRLIAVACSLGFAFMLTWAFFNLVWGLTAVSPVSLAGPGLAIVVAAGEQMLAYAWNRGALTKDR